jgi:hypothetical protein
LSDARHLNVLLEKINKKISSLNIKSEWENEIWYYIPFNNSTKINEELKARTSEIQFNSIETTKHGHFILYWNTTIIKLIKFIIMMIIIHRFYFKWQHFFFNSLFLPFCHI